MRLPIALVLLALVAPASAHAGALGLEGSELVYRADPGVKDELIFTQRDGVVALNPLGADVRLGAGCANQPLGIECPDAGLTGLTVIAGDGADDVSAFLDGLPLTFDLGEGDDHFDVSDTRVATIAGGPGNDGGVVAADAASVAMGDGDDGVELDASDRAPGPYALDGGPGADELSLMHRGPGITLSGGDGDDRLFATATGRAAVTITCGLGADRWVAAPRDVPGDGCASHLAGITTESVSRAFQEGALTGPASGSVTFRRRVGQSGRAHARIARGVFTAQPGPLRLSLKRTSAGQRWLRRNPNLPVFVTILTRTGSDRGEVTFRSKVG